MIKLVLGSACAKVCGLPEGMLADSGRAQCARFEPGCDTTGWCVCGWQAVPSLIWWEVRRKDFAENMIHHFATLGLIIYSYQVKCVDGALRSHVFVDMSGSLAICMACFQLCASCPVPAAFLNDLFWELAWHGSLHWSQSLACSMTSPSDNHLQSSVLTEPADRLHAKPVARLCRAP